MSSTQTDISAWYRKAADRGLIEQLIRLTAPTVKALDVEQESFDGKEDLLHTASLQKVGSDILALIKLTEAGGAEGAGDNSALLVVGANSGGFSGTTRKEGAVRLVFCPRTPKNAAALRRTLPFTAPSPCAQMDATFGVGDRLGIASPGHARLFQNLVNSRMKVKDVKFAPIFAQQSVRENTLCGRTYEDVLDAATWAVFQEGYRLPWGADGDHLKEVKWVKKCLKLGYTMITADVSDYIRGEFASIDDKEIVPVYETRIDENVRRKLEEKYVGTALELDTGETIQISRTELARTVLIYNDALDYTEKMYQSGKKMGRPFDFELSIDETETPTRPEAHVYIAMEMEERGVPVSSLAPRFVGEFQKGIDYIGDKKEFDASFRTHAAIARRFGYRISVHSGSDKFLVFPTIGKETAYRFHLKTAGTNWLQALLVIAQTEPEFFRTLYRTALEVLPDAMKYYHITPNMGNVTGVESLSDDQLTALFDNPDARQVMHVTYGEMLKDEDLGRQIFSTLYEHIEEYWQSLIDHIGRHLEYLGLMK